MAKIDGLPNLGPDALPITIAAGPGCNDQWTPPDAPRGALVLNRVVHMNPVVQLCCLDVYAIELGADRKKVCEWSALPGDAVWNDSAKGRVRANGHACFEVFDAYLLIGVDLGKLSLRKGDAKRLAALVKRNGRAGLEIAEAHYKVTPVEIKEGPREERTAWVFDFESVGKKGERSGPSDEQVEIATDVRDEIAEMTSGRPSPPKAPSSSQVIDISHPLPKYDGLDDGLPDWTR